MKNIRKFLGQEGYLKKENKKEYNKIIDFVSKLPLKKNISNKYVKEINTFFKKNKNLNILKDYLNKQWKEYFINKSLELNKIEVKFRTNNTIENYNKSFKEMIGMNANMQSSIFIDNITNDILHHIECIRNIENKNPHKNKSKYSIKKENEIINIDELKDSSLNDLINDILNEDNSNFDNDKKNKSNLQNSTQKDKNNISDKEILNTSKVLLNQDYKYKLKFNWFINDELSCAYDSITTVYIFSLYPFIKKIYFENNEIKIKDQNSKFIFECYTEFILNIIQKYTNNEMNFYSLYFEFIKNKNDLNFLDIKMNEINVEIPLISTYRIFQNNDIFCLKYEKIFKCNGNCKYKNKFKDNKISLPYLNLSENNLNNNKNLDLSSIIFNDIFEPFSKICDQNECIENNNNILNIYYNNIVIPYVLSIHIDIEEYDTLLKYKPRINSVFADTIKLKNSNYTLVGIIFYKNNNKHYFTVAFNNNNIIDDYISSWLLHDDLRGNIEVLDKKNIGYKNYRDIFCGKMFIYKKDD